MLDGGQDWLQFLPSLVAMIGLAVWIWRRREPWTWRALAGPLLLISVITAAYTWSHDQVVLLPAVVAIVTALRAKPIAQRQAILGALVGTQVGLWVINRLGVPEIYTVWHAPILGGLYWWAKNAKDARTQTTGQECG